MIERKLPDNRKAFGKDEVSFEHPAKGANHCGACKHFMKHRDRCQIVSGVIRPEDWCRKFERKPDSALRSAIYG